MPEQEKEPVRAKAQDSGPDWAQVLDLVREPDSARDLEPVQD